MELPSESLVQLLGRIKRPKLHRKGDTLFELGPQPKEVIELTGCSVAAPHRTHICIDVMANFLLPASYENPDDEVGSCGIVLLDANQQIDIFKLVRFMEARVSGNLPGASLETVQGIIKKALGRLAIYQVFEHSELIAALQSAQNYIFHHRDVSLVLLDSISAFYWTNVADGGIRHINRYVDDVLKTVNKYLGAFDVTFLYTRAADFFSKSGPISGPIPELSVERNLRHVNTRINVLPNGRVDIHKGPCMRILFFEATDDGIKYSPG